MSSESMRLSVRQTRQSRKGKFQRRNNPGQHRLQPGLRGGSLSDWLSIKEVVAGLFFLL